MKHKIEYSKNKEAKVLQYVQFVAVCAELVKIEYQEFMVDTRFKNPVVNNHSKRIIESADAISRSLSSISYNTDREEFLYGSALQFHRLAKHFMALTTEQVSEFMDLIDGEMKKGRELCES